MDFINLSKLYCPRGHDTLSSPEPHVYHCDACRKDYRLEELQPKPIDRSSFKPLDPHKVYGKLN